MLSLGELPKQLKINNEDWAIRSDFRVALNIFQAINDVDLSDAEKVVVMLDCLYIDFYQMKSELYEEAIKQANWFLNGGKDYDNVHVTKKVIDWEQDEQLIFSAVNKVAGKETREVDYIHWWTFLGYFSEVGEGLFSTVVNIRSKKNRGKKLEKYEEEFYKNNKDMIDIRQKYTEQEKKEMERLNKLFM